MSGGVFICYRREESAFAARVIYDRVAQRLGPENFHLDIDNIDVGVDWFNALTDRIGACDALVAIIGRNWISNVDKDNRRKIDDTNDFVRIEIEAALKRDIRVIPVLLDGAVMPKSAELPDSLKGLARRQGIEISSARFEADVEKLTAALGSILDERRRRDASDTEKARRAEEERRLKEAAETERAAREERERREGGEAARAKEARRLAEAESARRAEDERRAREAAEAERVAREKRKSQEGAVARPEGGQVALQATAAAEAERPQKKGTAWKNNHLFMSYCNEDEAEVQSLVDDLEKRGHQCWYASRDVQFNYQIEIVEAIRSAPALIVVISERANSSDEIPKEIALARKYRVRTIPVRIEDTWPNGALEYELSNAQNIDLFKGRDTAIGKLIRLLDHAK
jgi:hypothetical protein